VANKLYLYTAWLIIPENNKIYTKTNFKFHLTSQVKWKKMDRRRRKDGKESREGKKRG